MLLRDSLGTLTFDQVVVSVHPTLDQPVVSVHSTLDEDVDFICLCLPPDKTWHKVSDLKVGYSGDYGRGSSSAHLVQCRLMSQADHGPKSGSKHVCLIIA